MEFKKVIQYDNLKKVLDNFSYITGISANFMTDDGKWIENEKKGTCEFCKIMKKDYKKGQACGYSDKVGAEIAKNKRAFHIYECHMGLQEVAVPIFYNNIYIGTLFIGQILLKSPTIEQWGIIEARIKDEMIDIIALKKAFFNITVISEEKLYAAIDMMNIVANYIINSEMIRISSLSNIDKIIEYINNHYNQPINLYDLSKMVYLSPSYLSYLFKKQMGMGFKEYLNGVRIKKAKQLILESNLSLSEIAKMVGMEDPNYFSRLFKKYFLVSPQKLRKQKI